MALSHLLSPRTPVGDDDPDAAIGRAEARVALARLEVDSLRAIQASRPEVVDDEVDVDALVWRVLSVLASHQAAAVPGGPGPAPLVLDEPFGDLGSDDAAALCEALVGPSHAVQVVIVTDRDDVADWVRSVTAEGVGLAAADLTRTPV